MNICMSVIDEMIEGSASSISASSRDWRKMTSKSSRLSSLYCVITSCTIVLSVSRDELVRFTLYRIFESIRMNVYSGAANSGTIPKVVRFFRKFLYSVFFESGKPSTSFKSTEINTLPYRAGVRSSPPKA